MKPIADYGGDLLKTPKILRVSVLFLVAVAAFYLGKHFSDGEYPQFVFFNSPAPATASSAAVAVAVSPNANLTFNISDLSPPPPPPARYGVVDGNGTMRTDFDVGEFDPDLAEIGGGGGGGNETGEDTRVKVKIGRFRVCDEGMREYIPCLDNVAAIKKLKSRERGERFERHCPEKGLDCLVPAPKGYKVPIPWPQSRDEVWFELA